MHYVYSGLYEMGYVAETLAGSNDSPVSGAYCIVADAREMNYVIPHTNRRCLSNTFNTEGNQFIGGRIHRFSTVIDTCYPVRMTYSRFFVNERC